MQMENLNKEIQTFVRLVDFKRPNIFINICYRIYRVTMSFHAKHLKFKHSPLKCFNDFSRKRVTLILANALKS